MRVWMTVIMACTADKDTGDTSAGILDGDTDTDTDADSDSDSDSDTDTDTGSDAQCPAPWTPLAPDLTDCVARWTYDESDDGAVERRSVETYDADGRLVLEEFETVGDPPVVDRYEYDYDDAGHLVAIRIDSDADGTVDSTIEYYFDAEGNNVGHYIAFASFVVRVAYTVGPCGPEVGEEDDDDDGTIDAVTTFTYTPKLVVYEADDGLDGTIDFRVDDHYDAVTGTLDLRETESDPDHAGFETVTEYTYDADHRLVASDQGGVYERATRVYTHDANSRVVEVLEEIDGLLTRESAVWTCP